jgi:hypothetical protein
LHVSVANMMAFSPTDNMPLARWAKARMTLEEIGHGVDTGLLPARAVNVLGWRHGFR